jgi:hypothetical protein
VDWLTIVRLGDPLNPPPPGYHRYPGTKILPCGASARAELDARRVSDDFGKKCDKSYSVWYDIRTGANTVYRGGGSPGPGFMPRPGPSLCCEQAYNAAGFPLPARDCRALDLASVPGTVYFTGTAMSSLAPAPVVIPSQPPVVVPRMEDLTATQYEALVRQKDAAMAACDFTRAAEIARSIAQRFPSVQAAMQSDIANLEAWNRYQSQTASMLSQMTAEVRQSGGLSDASRQQLNQVAALARPMPCLYDRITRAAAQFPAAPGRQGTATVTSDTPGQRYYHYTIEQVTGTDSGGNPRDRALEREGDLAGLSGSIPVGYSETWANGHANMSGAVSIGVSGSGASTAATISARAQWDNASLGLSRRCGVFISAGGRDARRDLGDFTNGATQADATWTGALPGSASISILGKQNRIVTLTLRTR